MAVNRILAPLPVDPTDPAAILPNLEEAIAGRYTFLPLPAADPTRAQLLKNSQAAGKAIDPTIALVVPTSGSTGTPKGAQLTAANLVASADATHQRLGGPGQWLLAMPAHYIAGLQVLVRSLVAGVEPAWIDLSGGFNIDSFADAAEELHRTGDRAYTSLTPMQLSKAMDSDRGRDALRGFHAILVGGAATHPHTLAAAEEAGIQLVTTYGSSETAGGCVYDGYALPGTTVKIADDRIILGGPTIAHGYRSAPDHEAFAEPGWFITSDSGYLDGNRLTVTGRLDNIIDSGGLKLHPEVLEREILSVPGVDTAAVTSIPHPRLGQAIVAAYTGTATVGDILEGLADAVPRWQIPKDIKRVDRLPMTSSGKVDRRAASELFR